MSKLLSICIILTLFLAKFSFAYRKSQDPYKVLGLPRGKQLSKQDVLKAYRYFSLQYHPDKNSSPEAAIMFQTIVDAKSTLLKLAQMQGGKSNPPTYKFNFQWFAKAFGDIFFALTSGIITTLNSMKGFFLFFRKFI